MDDAHILFRSSRFTVSRGFLRTPRKTYALREIDYVQVKRPYFLVALGFGALLLAWALVFHDLLYTHEWLLLIVGVASVVMLAASVGTLVVHSWSLRGGNLEGAIIWDIATVRKVRTAIDQAMLARVDQTRKRTNRDDGGRGSENE